MKARQLMLVGVLCALSLNTYAQRISKTPVSGEADINKTLFEVDTTDINYYFRANLPDNNFLTIEYKKMSYWPDKGFIKQVFATAREVAASVADSFARPATSKRIDINIPINNELLSVKLVEHPAPGNILLVGNGGTTPLKLGMDTIRIVKTFGKISKKKYESLVQVQYTFILKDLEQINTLANDRVIDSIENAFDNLVEQKRDKWLFPNAWYNGMDAVYDPYNAKAKKTMVTESRGGLLAGFDADANIGVSLFRNELAPTVAYGLTYKWLRQNKDYMFVGLSLSSMGIFERAGNKMNVYDVSFVNAEVGAMFSKPHTLLPMYRTSLGVRYLVRNGFTDPTIPGWGYSLFAKYSLSRSTSVCLDLYNFEPEEVSFGVSIYFKIL